MYATRNVTDSESADRVFGIFAGARASTDHGTHPTSAAVTEERCTESIDVLSTITDNRTSTDTSGGTAVRIYHQNQTARDSC